MAFTLSSCLPSLDGKRKHGESSVSLSTVASKDDVAPRTQSATRAPSVSSGSNLMTAVTSNTDAPNTSPTLAHASFIKSEVAFGDGTFGPKDGQSRSGYTMPPELLESCPLYLVPIPEDATLAENGFEMLSIRDALADMGITEDNIDAASPEHRIKVGQALMMAAEQRFGKRAVHLADTSRVSGSSVYGEATVRDTRLGSNLRAAQHVFHMDKFLPGIAKLYGEGSDAAGAAKIVDGYWHLWQRDFEQEGVGKEEAATYVETACPGMLNLWVSLTPGRIVNEPLAVADMRNILLDDKDIECVSTHAIVFPGLLEDTITVMRRKAIEGAQLMYRPDMTFGEVILFSTTHTPHSAVWLDDQPAPGRCSAEIRLLMVDGASASS